MKKLILTAVAMVGASMAAYSQGDVNFDDENTPGYVVIDVNGYSSSSTASYTPASDFTAQLYALPGNATLTSLTAQPNSYGYLTVAQFNTDVSQVNGLALVGTTLGGSGNGITFGGGDGYFAGGTLTLPATTGADSGASDVLALVCWTGTYANLAAAIAANADVGIFAFVNPIGAGGTDPNVPELTGWPTTLSPANSANDGYPEMILSPVPVPEPTTLAIAALGGLSLLGLRRKKA